MSDAAGVATFDVDAPSSRSGRPRIRSSTMSIATGDDRDRRAHRLPQHRRAWRRHPAERTPVFLRGISLHEENPLRGGRAYSVEDARLLLGWAKELGCNFVRLAHYPHNEHMARVADELGLMVWEEVPVYWTIQWENPQTLANAQERSSTELIARDRNRASVIVWSVANETPVSEPRTRFLKDAGRHRARARPHAPRLGRDRGAADRPMPTIASSTIRWARTRPAGLQRVHRLVRRPAREAAAITLVVRLSRSRSSSASSAPTQCGPPRRPLTRFSEEYRRISTARRSPCCERIPQWRGTTPWILTDFRSPRRPLPGVQDGWNRKG